MFWVERNKHLIYCFTILGNMLMIRLELQVTILPFISDIIKVQPQYVTATVSSINNDHNVSNRETCTSRTTQETLYTIQCNRFYQRAKISILVPFVNYITFLSLEKKRFPLKGFFFPSFRSYSLWCLFCMVYYSFQCEQRYRGFGLC